RYIEADKFEGLVVRCQNQTTIRVRGKDLFFVSMVGPDPYFAKEYINTLVSIYVEENLADKREESYGANRFLTEQVAFYKQKLDEIDAKIIDFRKETGIYSTVNEAGLMAQIAEDEAALKMIKGQKIESYATIKTIKQQLSMMREPTATGFNSLFDDVGGGSRTDYRIEQLQAKIDELLLVYNDQYPTIVKMRDQIEELQKRQQNDQPLAPVVVEQDTYNPVEDPVYVDLKMRSNAAQSDLNALLATEKELLANIGTNQDLLRNFPQDKKKLNDLARERAMQSKIYEQLLQRVGISEVSKQMEVSDKSTTFRIVDPAILPTKPVGIKRIFIMLLGLLGGLVAGLGAVYIAEHVDNTIKGPQPLRDLGVTVLAEIPFIWSDAESKLMQKKDRATLAFAAVCVILIGIMMLHDLLGMSFIDRIVSNLRA
ncbi:MAG: hypothetical protein L3J79_08280, partial [Candidatus Marinimicrobia bacterium]|nr:hypothetical protein [Candidatus Neomarinimicrobiota bacterium]